MVDLLDFIRANAALISLALLCYCVWRLRQIEKRTEAIRFILFRDYEHDLANLGQYPLSKTPR
jgi:hypothetical protein